MMLLANAPNYDVRQTAMDVICGDAVPTELDGYVKVPYPANTDNYLDATRWPYVSVPSAKVTPAIYLQLVAPPRGLGLLEGQGSVPFVIPCITGLK